MASIPGQFPESREDSVSQQSTKATSSDSQPTDYSRIIPAPPKTPPHHLPHPYPRTSNNHFDKSRIKSIVRKALLKEYTIVARTTYPPKAALKLAIPARPTMRMKDSDDYLTARAANPRTGLISPSVGSPSPRTPESPAEALKLRPQCTGSPISHENGRELKARPALTRADEARKIGAVGSLKWRPNPKSWFPEDATFGIASPRTSDASAGAADIIGSFPTGDLQVKPLDATSDDRGDDRFVFNMPSAREPQPYAYPGRSAEEIQAFEHYKRKARKSSGEGWDQRCVQSGGIRKPSAEMGRHRGAARLPAVGHDRSRKRASGCGANGQLSMKRDETIVRRGIPSLEILDGATFPGADLHYTAASFAPYQSPKTPSRRTSGSLKSDRPITHLSQLPRLHLVHPELAGIPMPKLRRSAAKQAPRSCSLGCDPSPGTGSCEQLKHASKSSQPLFASDEEPSQFPMDHATALISYLMITTRALYRHIGASVSIRVPEPAMIATLTSPEASVEEKVAASRALLTLVGQVVGVLMAMSAVWKLLDALAGVLGVLIWPLVVPFRVAWWVLVG